MLDKIQEAIDEIGYTNENIENKNKGHITFLIYGDFDSKDMENEMHFMLKDIHGVSCHDVVTSRVEDGYRVDGAYVTFVECEVE